MKKQHNHQGHHKMIINDFKRRFWVSLVLTIPILILSPTVQNILNIKIKIFSDHIILFALSACIFLYGGWPFLRGIVKEITNKSPGMQTLIATAITIAFIYSFSVTFFIPGKTFFWELATLIDVMLLGHLIEMKSLLATSNTLEKLVKLLPKKAHLIEDNNIKEVVLQKLKIDDVVLVKPGEQIPVDGIVVEGQSTVNEAMVTGESKPVDKNIEDKTIAGSINLSGSLKLEVEKTGKDTYLAQVIKLVQQTQKSKSRAQTIANQAAFWLTIIALSVGTLTFLTWFFIQPSLVFAVERMVTVMVITCPHALGLAIPLVVVSIAALSANNGILIRNQSAFERARNLDVIMFDKTGTLTKGELKVTDIKTFEDWNEDKVLSIAAGLEVRSEHYIARYIVEAAKEKNIKIPDSQNFEAVAGKGILGNVNEKKIFVGNEEILSLANINLQSDSKIKMVADKLEQEAKTIVFICDKNSVKGLIALSDVIRKESLKACKKLKSMGYKIAMITGDNKYVANSIAEKLKIDIVFARVLPDQKADTVKELQNQKQIVAMVGDGINDAPALTQSDIGIAIGSGTEIAIESADVILINNNPNDVVNVIKLSRVANSKMKQNLIWATGYNIITIPLAAGVLYNWGFVLPPAIGALIMSLSTIIVASNSTSKVVSRLYRHLNQP